MNHVAVDDFLGHCDRELRRFEELLDGDLSRPVVHCGDWDVYRLADHLGRQNLWSAAAITEGHGGFSSPRAPRDRLQPWFRSTSETLLAALARNPGAPAWTIYPPETVGFWRRRRAHETLIHRWDLENALGVPSSFDDELVADGVAEVLDTMLPRQLSLGRADLPSSAIALVAPEFTAQWGVGEPVATVRAEGWQLLLLLWKRMQIGDPGIAVDGDAGAIDRFFGSQLVP